MRQGALRPTLSLLVPTPKCAQPLRALAVLLFLTLSAMASGTRTAAAAVAIGLAWRGGRETVSRAGERSECAEFRSVLIDARATNECHTPNSMGLSGAIGVSNTSE